MKLIESENGPICPKLKALLKAIGYNTYIPMMGFLSQGNSAHIMRTDIAKYVKGLTLTKATELKLGLTVESIKTFEVPSYMYHSLVFILDYVKKIDYPKATLERRSVLSGQKRTFASSNQ